MHATSHALNRAANHKPALESPASRLVLRRVRQGGLEHRFCTRSGSGELNPSMSHGKKAIQKAIRKKYNKKLAETPTLQTHQQC